MRVALSSSRCGLRRRAAIIRERNGISNAGAGSHHTVANAGNMVGLKVSRRTRSLTFLLLCGTRVIHLPLPFVAATYQRGLLLSQRLTLWARSCGGRSHSMLLHWHDSADTLTRYLSFGYS
jgi:hypothetical protein